MLKRARRTWIVPGSDAENLVHDCQITQDTLHLMTWHRQRDGVNRPGNGGAGDNIFGEDLSPRLAGMLLRPMGEIDVPWDEPAMRNGAVHYVSTCFDGSPAPASHQVMELDTIAASCPPEVRAAAHYPHWDHKQYVQIFGFLQHLRDSEGIGLVPIFKIISNGIPSNGFLSDNVVLEARVGPLGFVGAFDHTVPGNKVIYRDIREKNPDGSPNTEFGRFSIPSSKPKDWKPG